MPRASQISKCHLEPELNLSRRGHGLENAVYVRSWNGVLAQAPAPARPLLAPPPSAHASPRPQISPARPRAKPSPSARVRPAPKRAREPSAQAPTPPRGGTAGPKG